MRYSSNDYNLTTKMLLAERIVTEKRTENTEILLTEQSRQAFLEGNNSKKSVCLLKNNGFVLLDFGTEFQGGINISIQMLSSKDAKLRVVFGESVSEALSKIGEKNATNNHSVRDITIPVSALSTFRIGNTGFRFVKLEAIDGDIRIGGVQGIFEFRDIEYKGFFECNDTRLNEIWKTGAYTVHLNMQEYVWDGIKRDRLIWIGDMHPEISTITAVFGYDESVPKSLDFIKNATPPDNWMNNFPSYSMWWIIIHRDWYFQNGNIEYLKKQKDYIFKLLENILKAVDDESIITSLPSITFFVDWSSAETPSARAGFKAVEILSLAAGAQLCRILGNTELAEKCEAALPGIRSEDMEYSANKQIAALVALAGIEDAKKIDREVLSVGGVKGMSTFLGYYVLHTKANAGNMTGALDAIREYWGAMLDFGATTFWEDFDIEWTKNAFRIDELPVEGKNDIHGDFGKFCYTRFRHSLCHGWASGPTAFLSKKVLGVEIAEPGCKKIIINPDLGDLKWVKGAYPTPYGNVEIEHTYDKSGKLVSKVNAPTEIEIVYK